VSKVFTRELIVDATGAGTVTRNLPPVPRGYVWRLTNASVGTTTGNVSHVQLWGGKSDAPYILVAMFIASAYYNFSQLADVPVTSDDELTVNVVFTGADTAYVQYRGTLEKVE